jgi:hypothetical protein
MKRDCEACGGEGCITETVSGGRFDQGAEQWYPDETTRVCPECNGTKTLERPQHANLFNTTGLYQQLRLRREYKRSTRNTVILAMLRAA